MTAQWAQPSKLGSGRKETGVPTAGLRSWLAELDRIGRRLRLVSEPVLLPPTTKRAGPSLQMELTRRLSTVVFVEGKPQ